MNARSISCSISPLRSEKPSHLSQQHDGWEGWFGRATIDPRLLCCVEDEHGGDGIKCLFGQLDIDASA